MNGRMVTSCICILQAAHWASALRGVRNRCQGENSGTARAGKIANHAAGSVGTERQRFNPTSIDKQGVRVC